MRARCSVIGLGPLYWIVYACMPHLVAMLFAVAFNDIAGSVNRGPEALSQGILCITFMITIPHSLYGRCCLGDVTYTATWPSLEVLGGSWGP